MKAACYPGKWSARDQSERGPKHRLSGVASCSCYPGKWSARDQTVRGPKHRLTGVACSGANGATNGDTTHVCH